MQLYQSWVSSHLFLSVDISKFVCCILEPPSFVSPIENKETRVGETTVFECHASGSPKPRLTWLKNGRPLPALDRYFFTADNQLLIIVQTQTDDAGDYTCEMTNTLGTERGLSKL